MIGGYQIISLHNTNNVLGTSYSIKGLYKRVKKTIKQIKLEDLIIDNIKMENVFINVHLDGDNYVGTFGLYQITFKNDDTYTIEENSSGASDLYFVTTDSYNWEIITSDLLNYDNYPNLKQLYLDQPNMCIMTKLPLYNKSKNDETNTPITPIASSFYLGIIGEYVLLVKLKDNVYVSVCNASFNYSGSILRYKQLYQVYLTLTETGFSLNYTL